MGGHQRGRDLPSFLREVLARADSDRLKQLATPRQSSGISAGLLSRARSMLKGNYTQAEVANLLGVSVSALPRHQRLILCKEECLGQMLQAFLFLFANI
ncbi:MAG: hypothetical protein ACLVJ6_04875 [Merdibacter sp.]